MGQTLVGLMCEVADFKCGSSDFFPALTSFGNGLYVLPSCNAWFGFVVAHHAAIKFHNDSQNELLDHVAEFSVR